MKKLTKSLIITMLIIVMVMAFMPIQKVNAASNDKQQFHISLTDGSVPNSTVKGDANLDGILTNRDAYIIHDVFLGNFNVIDFSVQAISNMDVTGDGLINMVDAGGVMAAVKGASNLYNANYNKIVVGNTVALKAYYSSPTDGNAVESGNIISNVTWTSSDTNIATVDSDGQVTMIGTGFVTITATMNDDSYYDELVLQGISEEDNSTPVTIIGTDINPEDTEATVTMTVNSASFEEESLKGSMAGFTVKLNNYVYPVGGDHTGLLGKVKSVTCNTSGWSVQESNFESTSANSKGGVYYFDVEAKVSDYTGNIYKPLESNPSVQIKIGKNLNVKSGYEDNVKIVGNNIYARLDSSSTDEETINATELADTLNVVTGYSLEIDSTDNTSKKVYTGAKLNLKNSSNTTIAQYNIYLIGDICKDSSNVININDVAYLRQAIVGKNMTSKTDYEVKTTDVNWSNGTPEEPGLGDIGDVIAIRRRILNYKWDDTVQVVTTAPTKAVSQKTKFQDTASDNKIAVIPQGFKVSSKESEQKIDTGLVVIAPDGSEFVWVPVEDVSTMYGTDSNGNKLGKLYYFTDSNIENNTAYDWTETNGVMSWTSATGYREPDYLTSEGDVVTGDNTKGIGLLKSIVGLTGTDDEILNQWQTNLQNEFNDMIDSVSKHGGFYVGRYETSLKEANSEKIAQSKKGATSATQAWSSANTWYGLYQKEKEYSTKNSFANVVGSSMIWGSQYDQMMIWMQQNGYDVTSTTPKTGLYKNTGNNGKSVGTTGTVETDKMNNVYDLLGNGYEWTLEALNTYYRVSRGDFYHNGYCYDPSDRTSGRPYSTDANSLVSSRLALYIK